MSRLLIPVMVLLSSVAVFAVASERGPGTDCTHVGSSADDVLAGGREDDVICARGGKDYVAGNGGRDILRGGKGPDTSATICSARRATTGCSWSTAIRGDSPTAGRATTCASWTRVTAFVRARTSTAAARCRP